MEDAREQRATAHERLIADCSQLRDSSQKAVESSKELISRMRRLLEAKQTLQEVSDPAGIVLDGAPPEPGAITSAPESP
jgi:hypothetical protein